MTGRDLRCSEIEGVARRGREFLRLAIAFFSRGILLLLIGTLTALAGRVRVRLTPPRGNADECEDEKSHSHSAPRWSTDPAKNIAKAIASGHWKRSIGTRASVARGVAALVLPAST